MSKSDIGGLKALASHGSEGSSRERALARSLASSIYVAYIAYTNGVYRDIYIYIYRFEYMHLLSL